MAAKRMPIARAAKGGGSRHSVKIKPNIIDDLAEAVRGKDNLMEVLRFADDKVLSTVKTWCSSRSIAIDAATNCGGFPFGRLVEIFGQETTGKTTLTDNIIAQTQALNGVAAVADSEQKKDKKYSAAQGVNCDDLLSIQPANNTVEEYIEATRRIVDHWIAEGRSGKVPLTVVWDTVAGMPTLEEIDNPSTKQPGVAARELRRAMRQLIGKTARAGCLFVIVNQQYEKIGGFSPTPGVKRSTFGGGGIRYHATMRLELVRTGMLKAGNGTACGIECLCKVYKNQMASPREEAFAIEWGKGFNNAWALLEKLKDHRYVTSGGGRYSFAVQGEEPITWQGGWMGLSELLAQQPVVFQKMAAIYMALPHGVK